MAQYVALLRGMNVGGRRFKMADLRAAFESWGYGNVATVLASGNVLFEAEEQDSEALRADIEAKYEDSFGYAIAVVVWPGQDLQALVASNPYKDVNVSSDTRLNITFLSQPSSAELQLPYEAVDGNFQILDVKPSYVVGVVTLTPNSGTLDAMAVLEELFGKDITTRTWNTVLKLDAKLAAG